MWGVLAALMRFVPFIGPYIAAVFPVLLAAVVDPGWSTVLLTAALFLVTELTMGQVVEPLVFGRIWRSLHQRLGGADAWPADAGTSLSKQEAPPQL